MDLRGKLMEIWGKLFGSPASAASASPTPTPAPSMSDRIRSGLLKYQADIPAATLSSELAQAGMGLPDPFLPAVMTLMETRGGQDMATPNNLFNIGPGIEYDDPRTSIIGGGERNQKGFEGIMREGGLYQPYRDSGRLEDFFSVFTPPGEQYGNPSMEELLKRYQLLRAYFQ